MKFGVREICDVVLKAKAAQKIGNKVFYAGEPVCYFDTLKTSSMEGAATTVYAQGGRGNARLVAWEGERTVTFTMEDALISPEGFMILSGAGLIDATEDKPIYQHATETVDMSNMEVDTENGALRIHVEELPYMPKAQGENYAYVMLMKSGEIISEPFIPVHHEKTFKPADLVEGAAVVMPTADAPITKDPNGGYWILVAGTAFNNNTINEDEIEDNHNVYAMDFSGYEFDSVMVDYYIERVGNAQQIEITADKFGGNYYLEASTLFRDQNGVDMPAEFIIPNCKVQSNFTFTMASSGDPSSFTFTMDAFPDYTRFDKSKKVLAAIQMIKEAGSQSLHRHSTVHEEAHDLLF
jgi:hypothetical protein